MGKKNSKLNHKDDSYKDGKHFPYHFKGQYSRLLKKFSDHLVKFRGNETIKFRLWLTLARADFIENGISNEKKVLYIFKVYCLELSMPMWGWDP